LPLANGMLDLWFFGNTLLALFDRGLETPYYASCIGHAGYPYATQPRKQDAETSAAPVLFAESGSRYEGSGDVRPDRGMNGFCSFEIASDGGVELHFRDGRGHERCVAKFAKAADGALQLLSVDDLTA
jgi:hypothetical protein